MCFNKWIMLWSSNLLSNWKFYIRLKTVAWSNLINYLLIKQVNVPNKYVLTTGSLMKVLWLFNTQHKLLIFQFRFRCKKNGLWTSGRLDDDFDLVDGHVHHIPHPLPSPWNKTIEIPGFNALSWLQPPSTLPILDDFPFGSSTFRPFNKSSG